MKFGRARLWKITAGALCLLGVGLLAWLGHEISTGVTYTRSGATLLEDNPEEFWTLAFLDFVIATGCLFAAYRAYRMIDREPNF